MARIGLFLALGLGGIAVAGCAKTGGLADVIGASSLVISEEALKELEGRAA